MFATSRPVSPFECRYGHEIVALEIANTFNEIKRHCRIVSVKRKGFVKPMGVSTPQPVTDPRILYLIRNPENRGSSFVDLKAFVGA